MKKFRIGRCVALLLTVGIGAGSLWLFRFDLSFGPYYTVYDITLTDTLERSRRGELMFGSHDFMAGSFKGNAVNIGVTAPIPDSAVQEFGETAKRDPKYIHMPPDSSMEYYDGPPVQDPPSHFVKIPVRSRLPKRSMSQKYNFHFTLYPNDSIRLDIQVLDKNDCSQIDRFAATAFLRSGPCSF